MTPKEQQLEAWKNKLYKVFLQAQILKTKAKLKEARKELKALERKGTK